MKNTWKTYALIGLTTLALGITGIGAVFATGTADTTPGTEAAAETSASFGGKDGKRGGGAFHIDCATLVESGIIDQATADKITAYMESKSAERQTEAEALKNMTEEERKAYMEANRDGGNGDMFAELVNAGIITQEQADAIRAAMPQRGEGAMDKAGRGFGQDWSALVESGVIDQATADKITAYMESKSAERQTEMETLKNMTEEERKAYMEANKDGEKHDMLAELVDAGIITQEQADAIKAAMPERPEGAPDGRDAPQSNAA